jgi:hypothetical protein
MGYRAVAALVPLLCASANGFAQGEARVIAESFWGSAVTRAIASDFSARTGTRVSPEQDETPRPPGTAPRQPEGQPKIKFPISMPRVDVPIGAKAAR